MKYLTLCLLLIMSFPATAQESDLAERIDLARQIHVLRPVKVQIDSAVAQVAGRLPPAQRPAFELSVSRALKEKAIKQRSIDAMVEVYSLAELKAMAAYYALPESRSAEAKLPKYQSLIQPEIVKMLDQAIIRMRSGDAP